MRSLIFCNAILLAVDRLTPETRKYRKHSPDRYLVVIRESESGDLLLGAEKRPSITRSDCQSVWRAMNESTGLLSS